MSTLASPTALAATHPLADQVGGHAGVQTTEDESLVLKPALPREIDFYQLIAAAGDDDDLSQLRRWTSKFLGVLKLEGKLKDASGSSGDLEVIPVNGTIAQEPKDMSICAALSASTAILTRSSTDLSSGESCIWFREALYSRCETWDCPL